METAGVVEYDEREGTIVLTQPAEQFDIYMDVVARGRTIPWSEFYLGIGTIFTALTVLHWTNLPPFRYVPALAWAGLIAAVIAVTGAVHLHYSRKMQLGAEGPPPELELRREYDE